MVASRTPDRDDSTKAASGNDARREIWTSKDVAKWGSLSLDTGAAFDCTGERVILE